MIQAKRSNVNPYFLILLFFILSSQAATGQSLEEVHPELFGIEVNKFKDTEVIKNGEGVRQIYKINRGLQDFDSDGSLIESGAKRQTEVNPFSAKERQKKAADPMGKSSCEKMGKVKCVAMLDKKPSCNYCDLSGTSCWKM